MYQAYSYYYGIACLLLVVHRLFIFGTSTENRYFSAAAAAKKHAFFVRRIEIVISILGRKQRVFWPRSEKSERGVAESDFRYKARKRNTLFSSEDRILLFDPTGKIQVFFGRCSGRKIPILCTCTENYRP